jgi:hypothetical protein
MIRPPLGARSPVGWVERSDTHRFLARAARDIEGNRIKSIIDPRLADHVRREALKFVDELKRAH